LVPWVPSAPLQNAALRHRDGLEIDPRQKLIGLEGAHCAVGATEFAGGSHVSVSLLRYVQFPVHSAKFPVPILREFGEKDLNLFANARAGSPTPASSGKISLYFPAKQGIPETETGSPVTASTANIPWK
jgi:hypothetical protein